MQETRKKPIDSIDSAMIILLQKDGRISNTDMARQLNLSESTVRSRLKRLIDDEIIQIVAVSNPFMLGFELTGNIYIYVEMKKIDDIITELKTFRELWYIILTTGDSNINAEFIVKNRDELNDLIYNKISKIEGVIRIETSVIMKFEKRDYGYGTAKEVHHGST
ncbi:MAG: Lrp/AsnC family transcriptional regulator [Desulfobacteraceae bacterium]|jgi:Lrp/AsnC family transcriptional regulator for asnA, asnC and gidA